MVPQPDKIESGGTRNLELQRNVLRYIEDKLWAVSRREKMPWFKVNCFIWDKDTVNIIGEYEIEGTKSLVALGGKI